MAKKSEKANPKRTTSTIYARFYVGHENDKGELQGNGKFKKFKDAQAKAEQVAKKEGNSWVVSPRGVALWTHDGDGLFQVGHITAEQKKFYSAESYLEAEEAHFSRWEAPDNPLEVFYASRQGYDDRDDESIGGRHRGKHSQSLKDRRDESAAMEKAMGHRKYSDVSTMDHSPLSPTRPSDPLPSRRPRPRRPWRAEGSSNSMMAMGINVALFSLAAFVGYQFFENTTEE